MAAAARARTPEAPGCYCIYTRRDGKGGHEGYVGNDNWLEHDDTVQNDDDARHTCAPRRPMAPPRLAEPNGGGAAVSRSTPAFSRPSQLSSCTGRATRYA